MTSDGLTRTAEITAELRAVHATITAGVNPYCRACGTEPPCLVVRLLDRLAAETERADKAEAALLDSGGDGGGWVSIPLRGSRGDRG